MWLDPGKVVKYVGLVKAMSNIICYDFVVCDQLESCEAICEIQFVHIQQMLFHSLHITCYAKLDHDANIRNT